MGQSKVDMFVVTLASCVIWMMYGLADPPTPPFVILNAVGIVFEVNHTIFLCFILSIGKTHMSCLFLKHI